MTVNHQDNPMAAYQEAVKVFQEYGTKVVLRLLHVSDTTTVNEFKIMDALRETSDAYRFHGFAVVIKEVCETLTTVNLADATLMEKNKAQEARDAALRFIALLRSFGFSTDDLNETLGSVKTHNENAYSLGCTEAWVELSK